MTPSLPLPVGAGEDSRISRTSQALNRIFEPDRLDDEATSRHVRDRYLDFARHYDTANAQPASANG